MYKRITIRISVLIALIFSCKKENAAIKVNNNQTIKHAKGFDIIEEKGTKKLIIKSAYQNATEVFEYIIEDKNTLNSTKKAHIKVPVKRIVVTSTTHIPMIELLQEERAIIGFPNTKYVSSEKTSRLIKEGNIKEIGKENSLNTEILLSLRPELVVGYSISSADKSLSVLKKTGIQTIYNGDWLEETPLGRAEWIKFFGVLFNKEKEADSIFKSIESNYLKAKKIALKATKKPTILSGALFSKDIWNLPAGESFVAQFLKDANTDYQWSKTKGKGSLSISFETVFEKGKNADLWISPGYFSSKEQLANTNKMHQIFHSFQNNKIYTPTTKKGNTGGVLYYELAPTRPDLVLKDIIKISHVDLLPNYNLTFFEKMK